MSPRDTWGEEKNWLKENLRTSEIEGLVHTFEVLETPTRGDETSFVVTMLTGSLWGPRASVGDSLTF
ncbi:hypothetical protein AVEN_173406-1, partial [Araneus ventricosus]